MNNPGSDGLLLSLNYQDWTAYFQDTRIALHIWNFVGKKKNQRWRWHAIERGSGKILAYVFGRRKNKVFLELKKLLEPFGIKKYCTDD